MNSPAHEVNYLPLASRSIQSEQAGRPERTVRRIAGAGSREQQGQED